MHFGCTSLEGVELENQGGPGTAMDHWEKRILGVSVKMDECSNVELYSLSPCRMRL